MNIGITRAPEPLPPVMSPGLGYEHLYGASWTETSYGLFRYAFYENNVGWWSQRQAFSVFVDDSSRAEAKRRPATYWSGADGGSDSLQGKTFEAARDLAFWRYEWGLTTVERRTDVLLLLSLVGIKAEK